MRVGPEVAGHDLRVGEAAAVVQCDATSSPGIRLTAMSTARSMSSHGSSTGPAERRPLACRKCSAVAASAVRESRDRDSRRIWPTSVRKSTGSSNHGMSACRAVSPGCRQRRSASSSRSRAGKGSPRTRVKGGRLLLIWEQESLSWSDDPAGDGSRTTTGRRKLHCPRNDPDWRTGRPCSNGTSQHNGNAPAALQRPGQGPSPRRHPSPGPAPLDRPRHRYLRTDSATRHRRN